MKFKHLLLFTPFILFFACSSDSSTPEEGKEEQGNNSVLLKKIIYDIGTVDEYIDTFNYDGNKLISIFYGDDSKNVYTYNNTNLVKDEYFSEGNLVASIDLEYNSDGQMASFTETFFEPSGLDDRQYKYLFTYNSDGSLTKEIYVNFFNTEFELRSTEVITYDGENIVQISNDKGYKTTYTYDDRNGAFKNIYAIEIFNILSENEFGALLFGNTNNLISEVESDDSPSDNYMDAYEYTYNDENYPETYIYTSQYGNQEAVVETIEYFYE